MKTEEKVPQVESKTMKVAMVSCHTFIKKKFREDEDPKNFDWNGADSIGQVLLFQKVKNIKDEALWRKIQDNPELEHIILFVQGNVNEILESATKFGLLPARTVFLFCSCERKKNIDAILNGKFNKSKISICECGGTKTMGRLYWNIVEKGMFSHN